MSKISFTIALPHDGPDGRRPQFFLSTSNNTFMSFKGANWQGARFGNSNATGGFKNRFEYSVVAAKGITKFSIQMNTSVILPPLSWGLPDLPVRTREKEQEKERGKGKEKETKPTRPGEKRSSRSSSSTKSSYTSRSSRSSYESRDRESYRRSERRPEPPMIRSPGARRDLRELENAAYGSRRRHGSRREGGPRVVDYFDD